MNKKLLNSRYLQIIILIAVLMTALCIRLFVLTVVEEEEWAEAASSQNTKEVVTSAPRGKILDRYGRVLAENKQIFTVQFNVSGLSTADINRSCYDLTKLLEANGDDYVDNFPIKITKKGSFYFTYDSNKKAYLKGLGLSGDATAEDVLENLREEYEIDEDLDRYEAVEELQNTHGVWPPINVRSMTFTYDSKKKAFLEKYDIYNADEYDETGEKVYTGVSAEEAFERLRVKYGLDKPVIEGEDVLSDKELRKIFCIREEIKNTGYNKYRSSTIASDVSDETVAYIEESGAGFRGVEIASETVRVYPNGNTLSHVLGYMGSIADYQYEDYVTEKGYSTDDLIGKDGVEATMEDYLHGTDGIKTILVNSGGDYMETLSETEPEAGRNVYLTIDLDLQKKAERTLEKAIKAVKTGGKYKSEYGDYKMTRYRNCASGATVVVDVETGEVLASASYPDYDPNIFANGISSRNWASVQSTNPRDSLAPTPLYNNAAKASVQPGSTFKPVTAVAALECGLNKNQRIYDKGYIKISDTTFGCSLWNNYKGSHGYETLTTGIQNSCNYYFYCIATGKDWGSGASLGYNKRISIEKIMDVASEFGLGEKTGVELSESITPLASAERRLQTVKSSLWSTLYYNREKYWPEKTLEDDEALRKEVSTITSWADDNPSRGEIINRLKTQTTVKDSKVDTIADMAKYSYFNMTEWGTGDSFNIAIGQGDNAYTPLQMARYIAALGNNGVLNELTVVKGIEGEELPKKETYQVDVSESDINTVLDGMKLVVKNGTLAGVFRGFPMGVAGKTGTAQKDGKINPKDEVSYVKNHLSYITSAVTWKEVRKEMKKLMEENSDKYPTENDAVDQALINASDGRITQTRIDRYKESYDNFAWTVTLAPADNPKIAVVTLLVQGGISSNAAVVNREIIGAYFGLGDEYESEGSLDLSTRMN